MDVNVYIASGILENYVLGLASDQERQEVQCLSKIYPEIAQELHTLELTMEQYALEHELKPPVQLKTKLFDQLDAAITDAPVTGPVNSPAAKIISSRPNYWRYAAAALLTGVVILSAYFMNWQMKNAQQIAALDNQNRLLQHQLDSNRNSLQNLNAEIALTRNPAIKRVYLKGLETKDPQAGMTVYWNQENQQVFIAGMSLPATPANKQYQLWAIKNGQPVDLGVFDLQNALVAMKSIDEAQAFAVTLENTGGSAVPTLSDMVVIGQI